MLPLQPSDRLGGSISLGLGPNDLNLEFREAAARGLHRVDSVRRESLSRLWPISGCGVEPLGFGELLLETPELDQMQTLLYPFVLDKQRVVLFACLRKVTRDRNEFLPCLLGGFELGVERDMLTSEIRQSTFRRRTKVVDTRADDGPKEVVQAGERVLDRGLSGDVRHRLLERDAK